MGRGRRTIRGLAAVSRRQESEVPFPVSESWSVKGVSIREGFDSSRPDDGERRIPFIQIKRPQREVAAKVIA